MQDLIIYDKDNVIVQSEDKVYQDTAINFITDYGGKVNYQTIDYNRTMQTCWLNGEAFQAYPNTVCEDILNSISTLLKKQAKRECIVPTLEDLKILKIKRFKIERDHREVDKIVYNDNIFDFDDKARERMRIARADLLSSNVSERLWTCADDKIVSLSVLDFDNINSLAATRSEQLHFQYRKLKIVVQQCETLETLEHIDFDTDCSYVEVEVTNG